MKGMHGRGTGGDDGGVYVGLEEANFLCRIHQDGGLVLIGQDAMGYFVVQAEKKTEGSPQGIANIH